MNFFGANVFLIVMFHTLVVSGDTLFNVGDSTTLQSQEHLAAELTEYEVHNSVLNAADTWRTVSGIQDWMNDPDNDAATPAPGMYDVIRWNNGIWDAQPIGHESRHTAAAEFEGNIVAIVNAMKMHSPNAKIIFSTTPAFEYSRTLTDPTVTTADIDLFNSRLDEFRQIAFNTLPQLGVTIDDSYLYYQNNSPSDFGLTASRDTTGDGWKWDGVHLDHNYRQHEGIRTANAIRALAVPEPAHGIIFALGCFVAAIKRPKRV